MKISTRNIAREFLTDFCIGKKIISSKKLDAVATIVEKIILLSNPHKNVTRLADAEFLDFINANSMSVKLLKKELGRDYLKVVDTFFTSSHYDKVKRITRAYKLKDPVFKQLIAFINATKNNPATWVSDEPRVNKKMKFGTPVKPRVINKVKYGIFTTDENNKKIKSKIKIDALVPINTDALDECIETILQIMSTGSVSLNERKFLEGKGIGVGIYDRGGKEILLQSLWKLYTLKRLSLKLKAFPQFYIESANGRITGVGYNLQNTVGKRIRNIALSNQNMCDYDMEASTPTIFVSLGNKYNVKVPTMESYLQGKTAIRKALADKYDTSIKDIKSAMNSLFYGVGTRLGGHPLYRTGLYQIFKDDSATRNFLQDDFVKGIIAEHDALCDKIIENAKVSRGKALLNVMGKGCSLFVKENRKKVERKKNSLVSHIVFGYEAYIIQTTFEVLKRQNTKTYLLVNDGFVADEIGNLRTVEKIVIDKLKNELPNLQLTYSMKRL